ncbi:hypothetical protein COP1_014267 [Malus domestica]
MCSSQPLRIKPQQPLKKLLAKFKIKPRQPWKKSQVRFKIKCPPPLNQIQFKNKLWKVNKRKNKYVTIHPLPKAKDHLPHEAPCGPISTFKIKPRRPLKKSQAQFKIKPQRPLKKSLAQFKIKP